MPQTRDPYPFPRFENDLTFTGISPKKKPLFKTPTHLAQNEEPWNTLCNRATVSSSRHIATHVEKVAPKDSLDYHLNSMYDNHVEFFRNKNETLLQRQTVVDSRRGQSIEKAEVAQRDASKKEIRVWINPQKVSIYSIQGAIESHHNASTNRGYSRKHDGGFYST